MCNPNPPSLTIHDVDDTKISFLQVAEKVKNGEAKVTSMNMTMGDPESRYTKIIFEVYVDD